MTDLRRSISPTHLELLLQYLEQHPGLALASPRSRHDRLLARRMWERVTKTLNKVDGKVVKNARGWCRYWADLKCKTRRKYRSNPHAFTELEQRIIKLLTDQNGTLLPNTHEQNELEYQNIIKQGMKKIKRSHSDVAEDINQESNINTYDHTDKIYIINNIEHENDHKIEINIEENSNKIINVRPSREMYSSDEQSNSTAEHIYSTSEHNNSIEDQYNSIGHINLAVKENNSTAELNSSAEVQNNTTVRHKYSTSEHNSIEEHNNSELEHNSIEEHNNSELEHNSIEEHNNSELEHNSIEEHKHSTTEHNNSKPERIMYSTSKLRRKKTIEELKKEMLEFQLKRQKELFEMEKRERNDRHKLEMDILKLKRDILIKELNNLT